MDSTAVQTVQVDDPHGSAEDVEPALERQGEQEAGEHLHPGLHHAQLLQKTVPVAVQPLHLGFPATAVELFALGAGIASHVPIMARQRR